MTAAAGAVGVIGTGAVGQAVGGALVVAGLCDRLLVASRTPAQAAALADDLADMRAAYGSPVRPAPASVTELRDCAAVVVAVRARFTNTQTTDVRMGGARANAPVIRGLAAQFCGYAGTVLVVNNPVDLMTRLFAEVSGCPRVFGIGSSLDAARYRLTLAQLLAVPVHAVHGHVIGEHGDAVVVCASSTTVNGLPIPVPLQQVRDELARAPDGSTPGSAAPGAGRPGPSCPRCAWPSASRTARPSCLPRTGAAASESRCASPAAALCRACLRWTMPRPASWRPLSPSSVPPTAVCAVSRPNRFRQGGTR